MSRLLPFPVILIVFVSMSIAQIIDLPAAPKVPPSKVDREYDRFQDITVIRTPSMIVDTDYACGRMIEVRVNFIFKGEKQTTPGAYFLSVECRDTDWRFLDTSSLIVLADGQRIRLGDGKRLSDTGTFAGRLSTYENVSYPVSTLELLTISLAKKVEARAGVIEFSLSAADKQSIADLLDATVDKSKGTSKPK